VSWGDSEYRKEDENVSFRWLCQSLNATVAQPQKYPFGVNTTIELKSVTTTSGNTCTFVS